MIESTRAFSFLFHYLLFVVSGIIHNSTRAKSLPNYVNYYRYKHKEAILVGKPLLSRLIMYQVDRLYLYILDMDIHLINIQISTLI